MASTETKYLLVQPEMLSLGSHYVGAKVGGSFCIPDAGSCERVVSRFCGDGEECTERPPPDWLELTGPIEMRDRDLGWDFAIRTDKPGDLLTSLIFECDSGTGHLQLSIKIKDGVPSLGDVVLCDSPFEHGSSWESICSFVRILDALDCRVHCVDRLADYEGSVPPRTVILHSHGLLGIGPKDVQTVQRLVESGTNLVVLADEFYGGTTVAANKLLKPFGLQFLRDGTDESGLSREEKLRRIAEWQERYSEAEAGADDILPHPLTQKVNRFYWFRPCPVICSGPNCTALIRNPADPGECFAAAVQPNGYVVAVGKSLWYGLSAVGWPYDNDRFLANLIVGGDAESLLCPPGPSDSNAV